MSKKPKQEPVAWMYVNLDGECEQIVYGTPPTDDDSITPLYAAPSAAAAISSALAAPEPEPVAYFDPQKQVFYWAKPTRIDAPTTVDVPHLPLYASPPAAAPSEDIEALRRDAELGRWLREWLDNNGLLVRAIRGESLAGYEHPDTDALRRDAERLREEVRMLRLYGNKDCTAMADEAMKEAALAAPEPEPESKTPAWWVGGLTVTLMREGVNKHRAREIAQGYWEAYCQIPGNEENKS